MDIVSKYFPALTPLQKEQFGKLLPLYSEWNARINIISRKDIDQLYERHVLHALGIAKVIAFHPGTRIVDVGTGGGFPGIPLAILFPGVRFHLVDSVGKKITVVEAVIDALRLTNATAEKTRAEVHRGGYDFVVSRAVTALPDFVRQVKHLVRPGKEHALDNGILYLKGGDFRDELKAQPLKATLFPLSAYFEEEFFQTKQVIHLAR